VRIVVIISLFLRQYWPLFLVLLFGIIFVGITIYWRRRQRIIASTFKEGAKPSQKAFKFVNLEDFDVAAIEQAEEDEEGELSTQQHEDSEDELEGGEKKKKTRKAKTDLDRKNGEPLNKEQGIELQKTPTPGSDDRVRLVSSVTPSSIVESTTALKQHDGGQTPEAQSPQRLGFLDGHGNSPTYSRIQTEEELASRQDIPLISR